MTMTNNNNNNNNNQSDPTGKRKLVEFHIDGDDEMTRLALAQHPYVPPQQQQQQGARIDIELPVASQARHRGGGAAAQARAQAPPVQLRQGKRERVPPAYPWADTRRAGVLSLGHLLSRGITEIRGTLQCKRCERRFEAEYDLQAGFRSQAARIAETKGGISDRAPADWLYPALPACQLCGAEGAARPVIAEKKRGVNWLFLLLGGLLGYCTLEHLKYFCKHNRNYCIGAKDRVLYLTYLNLCNQLEPNELFNPHRH